MAKCMICNKQISMFSQKISDGYLCKECAAIIPTVLKGKLGALTSSTIRSVMAYTENPLFHEFKETASYGRIHLDEMHGLFLVSEQPEKIVPEDMTSMFYVLDLSNIGLYCTNPRVIKSSVAVDVKFNCEFESLGLSFSLDAKRRVFCTSKKVQGGTRLEWDEPGDFTMFRNMFNQMLRNESDKFNRRYQSTFMNKSTLDIFRSRCVFLLDEDEKFTKSGLKSRRNVLMKSFHSDVSTNSACSAQKINEAYRILLPLAEEGE